MANYVTPERRQQIIECLASGMGVRGTSRFLSISQKTVIRYRNNPTADLTAPIGKTRGPYRIQSSSTGLCFCGCGLRTKPITEGKHKGLFRPWVKGHSQYKKRSQPRARRPDAITAKIAERNDLRARMVAMLRENRHLTRHDVLAAFEREGRNRQDLSRILHNGLKDASYRLNPDGLQLPAIGRRVYVRYYRRKPSEREEFVLKPIPYENETDITYLTRLPHIAALDAEPIDNLDLHERVPSLSMDPAEALMWEEEQAERDDLNVRRLLFKNWQESNGVGLTSLAQIDLLKQAIENT